MKSLTKGEAEAQIAHAVINFEREYMGRGPEEAKAFIVENNIFIRLRGVLTPAEKQLAKADPAMTGRKLIKEVRQELMEKARPLLETIIFDIIGCRIKSLHTDISTVTGERVIIFTLENTPVF
jgi:uncharacterized protein YbcI